MEAAVCGAAVLQLLGLVSLSRSMYLFHVLDLASLLVLAGTALWESSRRKNTAARRFLLPTAVLALFAFIEVWNYYFFHLNTQKSFFFQIGVLLFLIMVSVLCGYFIGDMIRLRRENWRLNQEIFYLDRQIESQKERYRLMSELSVQTRRLRHDLKHQLAAIRGYLHAGNLSQLDAYLDELSVPALSEAVLPLCENEAVSAVAQYYQSLVHQAGIRDCLIQLNIPEDTGSVSAHELCAIVGNLLDNGITGCRDTEQPFIHMQSRLADGILTITMDNRCGHVRQKPDGSFPSTKPEGGIGLLSITAIAEKHDGGSRFAVRDNVFYSSVYLKLKKD